MRAHGDCGNQNINLIFGVSHIIPIIVADIFYRILHSSIVSSQQDPFKQSMIDFDQKKGAFESSQGRPHRVLAMISRTAASSFEVVHFVYT